MTLVLKYNVTLDQANLCLSFCFSSSVYKNINLHKHSLKASLLKSHYNYRLLKNKKKKKEENKKRRKKASLAVHRRFTRKVKFLGNSFQIESLKQMINCSVI